MGATGLPLLPENWGAVHTRGQLVREVRGARCTLVAVARNLTLVR